MRGILTLRCENSFLYEANVYHKLQGFIYSLIRDTEYSSLHNKKDYKFISFSNVFPPKNAKMGDKRTLIISSPENRLITIMKNSLDALQGEIINIGHMRFFLERTTILRPTIEKDLCLITGTPVIVRIPKEKFSAYESHWDVNYDYIYWRSNYPLELFIEQIEQNLRKKFQSFYGYELSLEKAFENFNFKKQVCNHITINGKEVKVIGTLWEIIFKNLDKNQRKFVSFMLDCGIGELNTLGFGFLNKVRSKSS